MTLIHSTDWGIYDVALDWLTGNLFGASQGGHIFVCKFKKGDANGGPVELRTLVVDEIHFTRIAVNPNAG